jgi:hypothetical protein
MTAGCWSVWLPCRISRRPPQAHPVPRRPSGAAEARAAARTAGLTRSQPPAAVPSQTERDAVELLRAWPRIGVPAWQRNHRWTGHPNSPPRQTPSLSPDLLPPIGSQRRGSFTGRSTDRYSSSFRGPAITDEASPLHLRSTRIIRRTAMHLGCSIGLVVGGSCQSSSVGWRWYVFRRNHRRGSGHLLSVRPVAR